MIRAAEQSDIPAIAELARRIWPVAYAGILTEEQINNMLSRIYSHENLHEEMRQGHSFWLAYVDGMACGYASAYREDPQTVWLKKLYVDTTKQKQGLGSQLIQALQRAMQPMTKLNVLVNARNIAAQHYYTHSGFIKVDEKRVRMGDFNFIDYMYSKPIDVAFT